MFKVLYACITEEHDIRLVVLAGCICIFGSFTGVSLLVRAREAFGKRRLALPSAAAVVFGTGVWTTHFVAELAFKPGLPIAYDTDLTALSLAVAIFVAWVGMLAALRFDAPIAGGCIIGAAAAAMHYLGMAAMRVPADIQWDVAAVALSLLTAFTFAATGLWSLWRGPAWRYRLTATGLLVAVICGLHFIAMAAIRMVPDPAMPLPDNVVASELLAAMVAATTIGIVMLGMSVSIVEEHLARRANYEAKGLRCHQEQLARVLRISGIGSVERDLQTGHVDWSPEACRIFGLSPHQIRHTRDSFYDLVHADDRSLVRAAADQSDSGIASSPLEYRIVRPNGDIRVVYRENDFVVDAAGHPLRRVSVFKDVTEAHAAQEREKELQRQLLHSQKLEALGTLAGRVAHDLNNTLVPILALSKLALEDLPEQSTLRGDLETISRASERARDLVKQILAFSRKRELVKQQVDLAGLTRDALRMLRASLPTTIQIVDQILEVPKVFGDHGELHQVIINLVTNAAHAIGGGIGKITVKLWGSAEREPAMSGEAGSVVYLSIVDTGCGMDKATLDRIFEPFFTTKGVGDGTGLGLSVVHGIVTRHGGRIDVRSKTAEGSEFTVLLPAVGQPSKPACIETAAAA